MIPYWASFGVALVILIFVLLRSLGKSEKVTLVLIAGPNPIPLAMSIQAHQPDRVLLISTFFDDESEISQQVRLDARGRLAAWLRGGDELVSTFESLDEPFPIPFTPPEGYRPKGDRVLEPRWEVRSSDDVRGIIGLIEDERDADEDCSIRMDVLPGAKAATVPLFFSAKDTGLSLWYTLETGELLELGDAGWTEGGKGPHLSIIDRGWLGGHPVHAEKVRRRAPSKNEDSLLRDVGLSIAPEDHMAPKDVDRDLRGWGSRVDKRAVELWAEDLIVDSIAHDQESAREQISDIQKQNPFQHKRVIQSYRKRAKESLSGAKEELDSSVRTMRNAPISMTSSGFRRKIVDKGYQISETGTEIIVSKGASRVSFLARDEDGSPAGFFLEPLVEREIWSSWEPEETLLNISIIHPRIEDRRSSFQKRLSKKGQLSERGRDCARIHSIDTEGELREVVEAVSEAEFSRLSEDNAGVIDRLRFVRAAELDVLMIDEHGITMFDAKVVMGEIDVEKRGFHRVSWLNRGKHHYVVSSRYPKIEYGGVLHFQRLSRGRDILSQGDQGLPEQIPEILELERSGCFSESDSVSFEISGVRFVYHPHGRMYGIGGSTGGEDSPDIGVILPEPELCLTGHDILSSVAKKGYLSGKIRAVAEYPLLQRKSLVWGPWQRLWVDSNFAGLVGNPKIAIFVTRKIGQAYRQLCEQFDIPELGGVRILSSTVEVLRGEDTELIRLDRAIWERFGEKVRSGQLRLDSSQWAFDPALDEVFETAISKGMDRAGFDILFMELIGTRWWEYIGLAASSGRLVKKINGGVFGKRMSFTLVTEEDGEKAAESWICSKWQDQATHPYHPQDMVILAEQDQLWVLNHDWAEQTIPSGET